MKTPARQEGWQPCHGLQRTGKARAPNDPRHILDVGRGQRIRPATLAPKPAQTQFRSTFL